MHDHAMPPPLRQFTSDNRSGAVPEVWAALQAANAGHAPSYGADEWTRRAADLLRETFECDCDVYFVATGTAANGLALAGLCESYQAVVCHEYAHVETDECGAPEFFSNGAKLLTAGGVDGKVTPATVEAVVRKRSDVHYPRPRALSLSQSTELGTVYSPAELAALCEGARLSGLRTHVDGARFANAVAALGCAPADLTWRAGVDVLCLGGTKNGMIGSEAVLFFDRSLGAEFAPRCKQAGQLVSKMRFAGAQWVGLLEGGAWLRCAAHANAMARLVERAVVEATRLAPLFPVQANGAFFEMPPAMLAGLRDRGWELYTFIGLGGVRFMCSWDTQPDDVERLRRDLADLVGAAAPATCRTRRA